MQGVHGDPRRKQFLLVAVKGGAPAAKLLATVRGSLEVRGGRGRSAAVEAAMLLDIEAWVATLAR